MFAKILQFPQILVKSKNMEFLSFLNYTSNPYFWATIIHRKGFVLNLTNCGWGFSLGDFFTKTSIHPGRVKYISENKWRKY
jgi:hypothetical protein